MTPTMTSRYQLLTESLLDKIETQPRDEQAQWLFLSISEEFKGRWEITSLWPDWFFDFEEFVGQYRTVSPAKIDEFLSLAEDGDYHVVFLEPPEAVLSAYRHLEDDPPFSLLPALENTRKGLFPWQTRGFNKLVRDEGLDSGLVIWDTGTGKTAFIASALLWHKDHGHPYDLGMVVVKKHNKIDTQRKLKTLAGLDSHVVIGTPTKRDAVYSEIAAELEIGAKPIVVCNYDSFRNDDDVFKWLIEDRDCLFFWDEMPVKLSNRTTQLYEAVQKSLWETFQTRTLDPKPRPRWMRQWALSATPIENSPEGFFNYTRLLNPLLLGTTTNFDATYVINRNPVSHKPERWGHLDRLEGKIEFMLHRASLEDPEIAKMFPKVMEDPLVIDWDPRDRAIYDMLASNAVKVLEEEAEDEFNVITLIQVMQMLCDAPSMIGQSAENRGEFLKAIAELDEGEEVPRMVKGSEIAVRLVETLKHVPNDDHHTKLDMLREILTEKHPHEKVLVYMTWASYGFLPLTRKLDEWGVSYVTYTGTDKQRQEAKDAFRTDPNIQVFLSSDKGSDSIDLPEAAVGINYNLPWTWTRKRQRQGRNRRVDSELGRIYWYDLLMANSVEDRKREIIETKHGYHTALFDGKAAEDAIAAKLSREDLLHILTGADIVA
jgi:SNF2 family DNA or RNA helicase